MARLSRTEQQAGTRARILDAARLRFLRDGYAPTSLDQIAEDAGYSKGAVYSNFPDKAHVCRAVLHDIHEEKVGELSAIAALDGGIDDLLTAVESWLERTVGDVGWTMLEMEFAVVSRGNPDLSEMIGTLHHRMHDAIGDMVGTFARRAGIVTDHASDDLFDILADVVLATSFGLGVQRAVDPAVSISPAMHVIRGALTAMQVRAAADPPTAS